MNLTQEELEILHLQDLEDNEVAFLRVASAFDVPGQRSISVIKMHNIDFAVLDSQPLKSSSHGRVRLTLALPSGWRSWGEREAVLFLCTLGRSYLVEPRDANKIVWLRPMLKKAEFDANSSGEDPWNYS